MQSSEAATLMEILFLPRVLQVTPDRLQVITPYDNHRQKVNNAYEPSLGPN
jgi:hypothetical protein